MTNLGPNEITARTLEYAKQAAAGFEAAGKLETDPLRMAGLLWLSKYMHAGIEFLEHRNVADAVTTLRILAQIRDLRPILRSNGDHETTTREKPSDDEPK